MVIYQAGKIQFLHHALSDDISDVVSPHPHYCSATGHGVGPSEMQSWKHLLLEMANVLKDGKVCYVAVNAMLLAILGLLRATRLKMLEPGKTHAHIAR